MKILILSIASIILFYSAIKAQRITNFITDASKMRIYGRVKSITEYYSPKAFIIYTFNNNKKVLKAKLIGFSMSMGGIGMHEFIYNNNGNMIEWNVYNNDESTQGKVLYKLDSNGKRIEEEIYNQLGDLIAKSINSYDEKGNKIETIGYQAYQTEKSKMYKSTKRTYTYDAKGNVIQEKLIIYDYDSNGNITNENSKGRVFDRKYDSKDNIIEERTTSEEGGVNYVYSYDKFGNWIKATLRYEKSKGANIIERKITYY